VKDARAALVAALLIAPAGQASAESGRFPDAPSATPKVSMPQPPRTPAAVPRGAPTPYAPAPTRTMPVQTAMPGLPPPTPNVYVPPSAPGVLAPPILPYRDGAPIPPGYHLEKHHWRGLVIGGLVTFGVAYAYALASAAANGFGNGEGWLALPVLGPWGALGARRSPCNIGAVPNFDTGKAVVQKCIDDVQAEGVRLTVIAFDGVMQLMGAGLLVAGLVTGETQLVRDDLHLDQRASRWRVGPRAFGRTGLGLGVDGAF
jgi:hypothetical protein